MDSINKAYTLLRAAETDLRGLIDVAVKEGRYTDVAKLAEIADLLGKVISHTGVKTKATSSEVRMSSSGTAKQDIPSASTKRQKTDEFPKFEIERDRLVKIGWSKKDQMAYEHRAERDLVQAVSLYLANVPNRDVFKMDDMLPIELDDGAEVPSYQAYLVLAWLRHIGLIEKRGKDGYQWVTDTFNEPAFANAWNATPRRE